VGVGFLQRSECRGVSRVLFSDVRGALRRCGGDRRRDRLFRRLRRLLAACVVRFRVRNQSCAVLILQCPLLRVAHFGQCSHLRVVLPLRSLQRGGVLRGERGDGVRVRVDARLLHGLDRAQLGLERAGRVDERVPVGE
jgi:hypothetical protein